MNTMRNQNATLALATALVACVVASSAAAFACPFCQSPFKPGTYTGAAQRVGNGVAYSWVTLDAKGKPASVGVTLTESALEGLPDTPPPSLAEMGRDMFALMLPKQAQKTAFDHISLDWNAKGHPPLGIYDKPHFDVHFYTIDMAHREKITATGADIATCRKVVPARFAPAGYIYATGTEVPMMGGHWIDPKAPELSGKGFTKTFLYGSYNGQMAFLEPMVTKVYLASNQDTDEAIALPTSYTKSAYYPTRYTIHHDPVRHEYTIALEAMIWRDADTAKPAAKVSAVGTAETSRRSKGIVKAIAERK